MYITYLVLGVYLSLSLSLTTTEEVLLFFKYYNPTTRTISYVGHSVENIERKFRESLCIYLITTLPFCFVCVHTYISAVQCMHNVCTYTHISCIIYNVCNSITHTYVLDALCNKNSLQLTNFCKVFLVIFREMVHCITAGDLFPALRRAASLHPDVPLIIFEV